MQRAQQQQPDAGGGGTPSAASGMTEDSDLTHGAAWWLPQPKPSLDEEHSEWRPAVPLAEALKCSVCRDLLKEAITAVECGHTYCYDCIDAAVRVGGRANFCPVCSVLLGPNPWEHNKLKYDFMLDALVRKVFPRPLLDAALDARRLDREEATRQAKASLGRRHARFGRTVSSGQLAASGAKTAAAAPGAAPAAPVVSVEVGLFPLAASAGAAAARQAGAAQALPPLPKPYLKVPGSVTLAVLKAWLTDRLATGKRADTVRVAAVQLHCGGRLLGSDAMTVAQVQQAVWRPHLAAGAGAAVPHEVMLLHYSE